MAPTMAILGSTGSIGRQTFDVCRFLGVRVVALTAHSSAEKTGRAGRRMRRAVRRRL